MDTRSLLERTRQAFVRERVCPEVLPIETDIVEECREIIQAKELDLETADDTSEFGILARTIQEMELDRLRYFLKSYLRARLYKIENHFEYYLEESGALSLEEKQYVAKFSKLVMGHFDRSFLSFLEPAVASLENVAEYMKATPKVDSYVFATVKETIGSVRIDDMTSLELIKDRVVSLPYILVREFILEGKVELI